MTAFTVLGASGFIGSHLVHHLQCLGEEVNEPARLESLVGRSLGHLIYCVGITGDFRLHTLDTVEAHVGLLARVIRDASFDSLTYLSSTRLYRYANGSTAEGASISMSPTSVDELYNFSKLFGEALTLNSAGLCRVVRLSNVYGSDKNSANFLSSIIDDAIAIGRIRLRSSLTSAKDYVSVEDACAMITQVARNGRQSIYNVASGQNVTNAAICDALERMTECSVEVMEHAPCIVDPVIDISTLQAEFSFAPRALLMDLVGVVDSFRQSGAGA